MHVHPLVGPGSLQSSAAEVSMLQGQVSHSSIGNYLAVSTSIGGTTIVGWSCRRQGPLPVIARPLQQLWAFLRRLLQPRTRGDLEAAPQHRVDGGAAVRQRCARNCMCTHKLASVMSHCV